jgi:hypothetical protein
VFGAVHANPFGQASIDRCRSNTVRFFLAEAIMLARFITMNDHVRSDDKAS